MAKAKAEAAKRTNQIFEVEIMTKNESGKAETSKVTMQATSPDKALRKAMVGKSGLVGLRIVKQFESLDALLAALDKK